MKWTGIVKKGEAARHGIVPLSVDRDAMAILSQQVCTTLSMPACIRAALIPLDPGVPSKSKGASSNGTNAKDGLSPSLQIALKGGLIIGGLGVELIFRSRPRTQSPFPRDLTTKATLLPAGQALDFQDRSPRAKVGGDPAAWVQVRDGDGVPLTDPIYVGRLGRGPCLMDPTFACGVNAETYISPFITSPTESDLTLTGEMTFDHGISLRVILRRREGALWWGRRPDAVFDFEVVSPGTMIHFPAQPIWTGESVDALKSLIFLDGEGEPIGNEHLLKPTVAMQ
jgi:hypothetical protein